MKFVGKFAVISSLIILVCLFSLPINAFASGSPHVPVGSWVYRSLERLEAAGLIKSGLLNSRPLTRNEIARLINEAETSTNGSAYTDRVLNRLKKEFVQELEGATRRSYLKAVDKINVKYLYSEGIPQFFNYNNKGDFFGNGSNFRIGLTSHARLGDFISFYLNPELRYPEKDANNLDLEILEAYASLNAFNFELTAGRESLWWGPGRHGALLLSSNHKPFDLVKITNPEPFSVPLLGKLRLTVFATRLEENRHIPNPYLAGIRLDVKPHELLQLGLSRTSMFGGDDRKVDFDTILNVITAQNENGNPDEPGNQLGAVDLKLTLPFKAQPVVLYGELGGEDEAGNLPSRIGYILGIYLPRILSIDNLSITAEYATNYIGKYPDFWYNHHIYKTGYTYYGDVIGHHMGTDAKDFYIEAALDLERAGVFELLYNSESSGRGSAGNEKQSIGISWQLYFRDNSIIRLAYIYDNLAGFKNPDDSQSFFSELIFSF